MGAADGKHAVVGELVAGASAERRAADGEQLALSWLDLPTRFEGGERDQQLDRAKRGRPRGAENRASRELRETWRKIGFSPSQWLTRQAQHTPESLARELGCTIAEAWDRLVRLYEGLQGYEVGRAAPVDGQGNAVPTLLMQVGGNVTVAGAAGGKPWEQDPRRAQQSEQNQGVTVEAAPHSHDGHSHEDAK